MRRTGSPDGITTGMNLQPEVWGDTLSGRTIHAEAPYGRARERDVRVRSLSGGGESIAKRTAGHGGIDAPDDWFGSAERIGLGRHA